MGAADWSELRVHKETGALSVLWDVRLDTDVLLGEDKLASDTAAAGWRSFKERN